MMQAQVRHAAKAIVGALIAGLGVLGSALVTGDLEAAHWVAAATATLVAFSGVYFVSNGDTP